MTPADVSVLSQSLTRFCQYRLRYTLRHGVVIDVHDHPRDVQDRLCDQITQTIERKGWSWDVWLDNGRIRIADRKAE